MNFALRLCAAERVDPSAIDVTIEGRHHKRLLEAREHFVNRYALSNKDKSDDDKLKWDEQTKIDVFNVMAGVTVHKTRGAYRVSNLVGRDVQLQVMAFLESIIPVLRKGLDLEDVGPNPLKRAYTLLEPNPEVSQKREKLAKRKTELIAFQSVCFFPHVLLLILTGNSFGM